MRCSSGVHLLGRARAHDVIVVGARAAGAATAMLLARRGVRTLLVADRPVARTAPAQPLTRAGVVLLRRWGVLDALVAAGTLPLTHTTFRHGDHQVRMSVRPSHGVDALYAPGHGRLEQLLVAAAVDAGAVLCHDTSVVDVVEREGRVAGVRVLTTAGRTAEIGAHVVVGADGSRSAVARCVGAPFSRVGAPASVTTYAYWPAPTDDGYTWIFGRSVRAGIIPTDDGEMCVFVTGAPERIGGGGVAALREELTAAAPELAAPLRPAPRQPARTSPARRNYIRAAHGPGWALVGEAGFRTERLGPHGATDALRDAELLARAILQGLDGSLDLALASYEAERERLGAPLFDVIDRLAGHRWRDAQLDELLRLLSAAMADEVEALAALEPASSRSVAISGR
jgi:2-polyprenyl-6-methoxyphenol hydroxylase-like FAD-dependent oxidoreductase